MPQFHLDNFVPQLVWLAIFFAILYFGIVRLTLPKLGRTLDAREDRISGDLSTAERAKGEADALSATYAAGIDEAHKTARTAIAEAKARATASVEKTVAAANSVLAEKAAVADASLSAARSRAMIEIESVATDAAADIVERLTGRRPDAALVAGAAKTAFAG
ncbi:ATPase [Sphingomonas paeninsulae]|jgi:F-type H+-transporting ATPase subunit b|uniref:ATP synthase subunit b n=1 Tax=Sphingomonas paeninsulae TaxID=2319844 RepID=A0A494TIM7_SPHPE|nr:ATPase [Sphingomonas paeninsulae]AYJ87202.1 ATPase [Sphingomonas paeninsulae]